MVPKQTCKPLQQKECMVFRTKVPKEEVAYLLEICQILYIHKSHITHEDKHSFIIHKNKTNNIQYLQTISILCFSYVQLIVSKDNYKVFMPGLKGPPGASSNWIVPPSVCPSSSLLSLSHTTHQHNIIT